MAKPPKAYTQTYNGLARELTNNVGVSVGFGHAKQSSPSTSLHTYKAIWDTGATSSAITKRVATECGLKPTGVAPVQTASEKALANTYLVSIWLPHQVCFGAVRVTEVKLSQGVDVLIGMDIIAAGDFAVTNKGGKTTFSFQCPSTHEIDFVKEIKTPAPSGFIGVKQNRNEMCRCGSGKKYKKCHGR